MIFAPFKSVEKLNGLIHKYHIDYTVNASSTNLREDRITNPFTSSDDRWCSLSRESPGEWLQINFTHRSLYISHFVLWSRKQDRDPISWYVEGCNNNGCYNLTVYENETIGEKEVFKTYVHGPFESLRYISTGVNYHKDYHHCAYKIELYGSTYDSKGIRCTALANNHMQNHALILISLIINK